MRIFSFLAMLSVAASAVGGELFESYFVSGKANNQSYEFKVTKADVASTPIWSPADENPPLSPRRAEQIAREQLLQLVPAAKEWLRREITVAAFGDDLHWIYVVQFEPPPLEDVAEFGRDYMKIAVLFDGRLIKPKVTPIPN